MAKMKKTHDLCVAIEKYTDKEGKERTKWQNVGFALDDPSNDYPPMLLISKTFNPAGVQGQEGKNNIPISMFPIRNGEADEDIPF